MCVCVWGGGIFPAGTCKSTGTFSILFTYRGGDGMELTFRSIVINGGGHLSVETLETSDTQPVVLRGDTVEIHSGGVMEVNMAIFFVDSFIIHQGAVLTLDGKVCGGW